MGFGAEVFKIYGFITLQGVDKTFKQMDKADKKTAEWTKGLNKLTKQINEVGLRLSRGLSVPLVGVGAAIGALALKTGNYASNLSTLNQATGLSTDTLQEFAHVATTAGGSSEALFFTITALTGKLPELAAGTGDTSKALSELGVRVTNADGSYRAMNELFPQIIEKLQGVADVTQRNTLAYDIFGKKTKEVTAFLGMSAGEMANLRKEAHDMGLVMGEAALKKADAFRVGVENLKAQLAGMGREIAVGLMPILNETLIPLIQTSLIPLCHLVGDTVQWLAGMFAKLSQSMQGTVIITGVLVAALGPALLIGAKIIIMAKNLWLTLSVFGPALTILKLKFAEAGASALTFAKTLPIIGQNAKAASIAATAGFGALTIAAGFAVGKIIELVGAIREYYAAKKEQKLNEEETRSINENTDALMKNITASKEILKKYEENMATVGHSVEEHKRLRAQYEDNVIALKEYNMQLQKKRSLTSEEIEATRLALRGEKDKAGAIAKTEYQIAQEAKAAEEAARKRGELAKKAAEDESRRKEALADLVKANRDAIDEMILDEGRLLDKQESAELDKAKALKASESELDAIRGKFSIIRATRAEEATEKEIEAAKEELKAKIAVDKEWDDKLLRQTGDRLRILAAERANELALVEETGADAAKIDEYYANEEKRIREEANAGWDDKLTGQAAERRKAAAAAAKDAVAILENEVAEKLAVLRNEYARELAEAEKSGADIARVKQYYEDEMNAVAADGAAKRKEIHAQEAKAFSDGMVGAVNKIGSLLSMATRNEEKRLDKQYKMRKEGIEANVADEEERAAALAALDAEMDAKKLALQREEAGREKALGIFNAIINTAQAVVSALKAGPIAGPILASMIAALGGAEVSVIASTPEPFEAGALIQGGRGGVTGLVGEGRQDELIMPMETGVDRLAAALGDRGASGTVNNTHYTININAGTVVADDYSAKQFARRINEFIILDNKRRGV